MYKNTSNDVDVDTSTKLIRSDSFNFQNSENYKEATAGVSNQDFPTTLNYASFKNNTSIESIVSNSDILKIEVSEVEAEWSRMQGMIETLSLPILKKLKNRLKHNK